MIRLTPRLKMLAELVTPGTTIADIGTDHAYLPAWLIQNGICPSAWACDVQNGPLENARETVLEENLEHAIDLRLGSGLRPLLQDVPQGIVMAGMGGLLMIELLEDRIELARTVDYLLLQPMTSQPELRRWLVENGFGIVQERLAQENWRYYEIIRAEYGNPQSPNSLNDEIGYVLPKSDDPLFQAFIGNQIRIYEKIVKEASRSESGSERSAQCRERLEQLQEVYRCALIHEKSSS